MKALCAFAGFATVLAALFVLITGNTPNMARISAVCGAGLLSCAIAFFYLAFNHFED